MDSEREGALWYNQTWHSRLEDPMRSPLCSLPLGALLSGAATSLLLTAACTDLQTVQPADLSPPHPPARVWVTRADHSTVIFNDPRVSGDSLIGVVNGQPQRLRLSETTALRVREPAPDLTAELVLSGVAGAALVYFLNQRPHPQGPCVDIVPSCLCCGS
jgi:hypothetical protein